MSGKSETVNLNQIKKEPLDPVEDKSDELKPYRQQMIGPFAVNDAYHEDKYPQSDASRVSDSDAITVRTKSRDGADSIASHESDKHSYHDDLVGELKYECHICLAKFRSARAFKGHVNAHRYSSDGQSASFLPCSPFTGHISPKAEQQNGSFKCDGCSKLFYSRDTYAMHMMLRAKNENCSLAKTPFPQINCDVKEEKNERVKMNIEAILSSFGHSSWSALDMHKMDVRKAYQYRGVVQEQPRQPHSSSDVLACTVCGEVMHSKDSLAMHMLFHARGDAIEEETSQRKLLPLPPLASPIMRDYVNALTMASSKMQTARNMAAFHQAAVNFTNDTLPKFDSHGLEASSKSPFDSSSMVKRMDWDENENKKDKETAQSTERDHAKGRRTGSPDSQSADQQSLQNGSTDLDESRSDMGDAATRPGTVESDIEVMHYDEEEEQRPKSLDSGLKTSRLAGIKRYHGKYKSYQRMKMHSLLRKYSKQSLLKRHKKQSQDKEVDKCSSTATTNGEERPAMVDTESSMAREILAAHGTSSYCQYCKIIFLDKTIYHLHMGLHNVNNPWQCNACGKVCGNRLVFSSHVLHY